jgi:peptidoglycan/xylan/chitin deacetylase (PgdA/CDA1 family)
MRTFRQLRSRLRPGIAILGYHRISSRVGDPLGLSTSADNFDAHLRAAASMAEPLRLAEAAAAATAGRVPKRGVVFTFDDGYSDNLYEALPLLERHRMPATVFVTSGNRGGEFWWDRLARLQTAAASPERIESLAIELERLSLEEREKRLDAVDRETPAQPGPVHRTLTGGELKRLASSPLVEIGAHTESHRRLPDLDPSAQRDETRRSRETLETMLGRPVTSFAYPHGAISPATVRVVRDAGYAIACCSKSDVVSNGTPPLELPRLWPGDWNGKAFERWLLGWLHA